jgi:hypothetical protein
LSGDAAPIQDYLDLTDPYLGFATRIWQAPDATRRSHGAIRDAMKQVCLGINYGMGVQMMAARPLLLSSSLSFQERRGP